MPESIKLKVELDTSSAELSIDELERRISKISKEGATLFRNIATRTGGSIPSKLTPEQSARQYAQTNFPQIFGSQSTLYPEFLLKGAQMSAKRMGQLKLATEHLLQADKLMQQGARNLLKMGPLATAGTLMPEFFHKQGAARAAAMGPLFQQPTNWRAAALGGATAMFSPWLGARMLNQAFGGFPGGGGGAGGKGGGGGLLGAMFGGGSTGFAEWYLLIRTIGLLNKALMEMIHAVNKGSDLYRQSAATATSTHQLAHLQATLGGIGLPPEVVNRMIQQTQFGRGGQVRSANDIILRAHQGAGGMAELQQMINMRKEMQYLFKESEHGAKILGETAASMNRLNMAMSLLKLDWLAFWEDLTKTLELPLRGLIHLARMILQGFHELTSWIPMLWKKMIIAVIGEKNYNKIFPFSAPGNQLVGGNAPSRPEGAWEKMGLIINGSIGGRDYARQTAENTKKIADHVHKLFPTADTNYVTSAQPNFNLP